MWMYPYYYNNFGPGYWLISPLISIIFIFIFVMVIIRVFRHGKHHEVIEKLREKGFMEETPLEILKRRYAKGEIDKKQFEEMKKDLS